MATPAPTKPESKSTERTEEIHEAIIEKLEAGQTVSQIAKALAGPDKKKAKRLRARIWRMVRKDEQFQRTIVERSRANMVVGLPSATAGQVRRASRGRTDAAKLVMEATGFHTPRTKQEHSGEIKITIDMARPGLKPDDEES